MEAIANAFCIFWIGLTILGIVIVHILIIGSIIQGIIEACVNLYHRILDKRIRELERRRKNGN